MTISDAQAHQLAQDTTAIFTGIGGAPETGFHFAAGNTDTIVDGAHSTHLSTSLKELESLNISNVAVGADGLTVDIGGGISTGADFDHLASHLPSFDGGPVTLNLDNHAHGGLNELSAIESAFTGGSLSVDLDHLSDHGITNLNIEALGAADFSTGNAAEHALHDLEAQIHLVDSASHTGAGGTHGADHLSLTISDAQAHQLAQDTTFSFAQDNTDTVVHSTSDYLTSTLSELEALNVATVDISGGLIDQFGIEHVSVDVGNVDFTNIASVTALGSELPKFVLDSTEVVKGATSLDVTLDLSNAQLDDLANATPAVTDELLKALSDAGITSIDPVDSLVDALSHKGDFDWLNLEAINKISDLGFKFEEHVSGANDATKPASLDLALDKELTTLVSQSSLAANKLSTTDQALHGVDLLKFTTPDKFGDLLHALTASGVSDIVVDTGKVSVSDALASALVDAGMLQALPEANMIIDASAQVVEDYAHLSTSLKAMSDLGVDQVNTGTAHQLYIDLGLPVHDALAMSDISHLLNSLDPANHATSIAQHQDGDAVAVSLVISDTAAAAIADAGGFTAADAQHLGNLGIHEVAVVQTNSDATTSSTSINSSSSSTSGTTGSSSTSDSASSSSHSGSASSSSSSSSSSSTAAHTSTNGLFASDSTLKVTIIGTDNALHSELAASSSALANTKSGTATTTASGTTSSAKAGTVDHASTNSTGASATDATTTHVDSVLNTPAGAVVPVPNVEIIGGNTTMGNTAGTGATSGNVATSGTTANGTAINGQAVDTSAANTSSAAPAPVHTDALDALLSAAPSASVATPQVQIIGPDTTVHNDPLDPNAIHK